MKQQYMPEPQSEGDLIICDGHNALMMETFDNGGMRLKKLTWDRDKRYDGNIGAWACWWQVTMTLAEAKALKEYMKGA